MEENKATIPYFVHEGSMARAERTIKRLFVLCIILIAVLVITNGAWIWYENQFEDVVTTEVSQEAEWDSGDVIINGTGEVNTYGSSEADSKND